MGKIIALALTAILVAPPTASAMRTSEHAFRLEDSSQGNVVLGAEQAEIAPGEVYGTVVLLWGHLDVHGQVEEVVVLSGKVVFHPGSRLGKSLSVMGGSFESKPGAEIGPEKVTYSSPGPLWRIIQSAGRVWVDSFSWIAQLFFTVFLTGILWGAGAFLFQLFPTLQGIMEGRLGRQWPENLIVGLFGTMLVPVFPVLLILSILGILLLPLYVLFLLMAGLVSYLGAALWAGHRLLPPRKGERWNPWGLLLGILAFHLFWKSGVWWALLPMLGLWLLSWGGMLRGARALWR